LDVRKKKNGRSTWRGASNCELCTRCFEDYQSKEQGQLYGLSTQHARGKKCVQNCGCKNLRVRDHSEELGLNGSRILKYGLRKQWENVDCIHPAQRDLVNAVTNIRVSLKARYLTS
jgi:hypothetical protein